MLSYPYNLELMNDNDEITTKDATKGSKKLLDHFLNLCTDNLELPKFDVNIVHTLHSVCMNLASKFRNQIFAGLIDAV